MSQLDNTTESSLAETTERGSLFDIENTLMTIWTKQDHPLHFATDKAIANKLRIFPNMVRWKRLQRGILGVPTRKRLYKEFIDKNKATDQSSINQMACKSRRIINNRYRKRISKIKRRISDRSSYIQRDKKDVSN